MRVTGKKSRYPGETESDRRVLERLPVDLESDRLIRRVTADINPGGKRGASAFTIATCPKRTCDYVS